MAPSLALARGEVKLVALEAMLRVVEVTDRRGKPVDSRVSDGGPRVHLHRYGL